MASETIEDIIRENARLRAALKPVLECPKYEAVNAYGTVIAEACQYADCDKAVLECQRIYNESEAK